MAILIARRREPRSDPVRAAVIVFGLWLVTDTVVFNASRTLLPYYTAMLAPGIAVLCAIGLKAVASAAPTPRVRAATTAALLGAVAWSAWSQWSGGALWSWLSVAIGIAALGVPAARRLRSRACVLVPVLALVAAMVGPLSACGWLLRNGGGAWDVPYAPGGTSTHPNMAFYRPILDYPVYGGYFHDGDAESWQFMTAKARSYNARSAARQSYIAVFSSAAASFYVAGGTDRVLVIGGYSGLMTTPSVDEISALLQDGRILYAILPGPMDTRAADPRIRLLADQCRPRVAPGPDDGTYVYDCE